MRRSGCLLASTRTKPCRQREDKSLSTRVMVRAYCQTMLMHKYGQRKVANSGKEITAFPALVRGQGRASIAITTKSAVHPYH